ncbi:hypothetical protein CerSpe_061230 [Prunus speciosa]
MRVSSGDGLSGGATSTASTTAASASKPISEIRTVQSTTRTQIQSKMEELRQLVGTRYRDLIDSAYSIVLMKRSSHSISLNISSVHASINFLSSSSSASTPYLPDPSCHDPTRHRIYGIACRVKYLVDTPENIWGLPQRVHVPRVCHTLLPRQSRALHPHVPQSRAFPLQLPYAPNPQLHLLPCFRHWSASVLPCRLRCGGCRQLLSLFYSF